jgi:potassium efflux system protein
MNRISRWAIALMMATLLSGMVQAQDAAAPAIEVTLPALRAQLDKIPSDVDDADDVRQLVAQTNNIIALTQKFVASRTGQLDDLNARLGELGTAPPAGTAEDPDVTRRRAALQKERNTLDANVRLARLLAVDAQQRGDDLLAQRRALFEAQVLERSASPLGSVFWRNITAAWPNDVERLQQLASELRTGMSTALRSDQRHAVMASLIGAMALVLFGIWAAESALTRLAARFFPLGRLRRSLLAVSIVATHVLVVGIATQWAWQSLGDAGTWGDQSHKLIESGARFALFMAFVIGLGRALLANRRPSWRLPPISNLMAARISPYPWLVALVTALIWVPTQVNTVIDASSAAIMTTHVVTALALTALTALMLVRLRRPSATVTDPSPSPVTAESADDRSHATNEHPLWIVFVQSGVALVLIAIWVLLAIGYVTLARLLASQLVWTGVVGAAAYLLFKFADDLCMALLSSRSTSGQRLQQSFAVAPQTLDQAAVVLSGLSRVALFFYMVIALIAPLGTGPEELFQRSGKFGTGLKVGEFQLVPGAIFGAVAVLVIGFIVLRLLKNWLDNSYLPNTTLEPGMRSSLTTLLGYVGGVLVVAFALSALGIGIERIAWVASALSVGIGFGLQAIVQNFISGLILLAERPVKVGDWVVLGTAEGDVRRINVRATEIQLGDRSTLIVPNSEFITKTVRNMTLANAEGRVLIRLPMPLTTDANKVREVMLAACSAHEGVLPTPEPSVSLEGIEGGTLIFQAIAYVPSPRLAGGVRSDLLFAMLDALKVAELPLSVPTSTVFMSTPSQPSMATPLEASTQPAA